MSNPRYTLLIAAFAIPALVLSACGPTPSTNVQTGTSTTAQGKKVARAPTGTYRTVPRYRTYPRGPYWNYGVGVGGVVGGAIAGAAIEREIVNREIEDAIIDDAMVPDYGGGDFGGGDWGDW